LSNIFSGFRELEAPEAFINDLYSGQKLEIWDKRISIYPNLYLELKSSVNPKHTTLAKVKGSRIQKLNAENSWGLKPRNREQVFALDALLDDDITIVCLTGRAGTGKTILSLAAMLQKIQDKKFVKAILTRPMSEVGRYKLGTLPGDVTDKFSPFLLNFVTNLENFAGRMNVRDLIEQNGIEIVPLQLVRGASFRNTFLIADEMQVCDFMETLTIGSRIGEGSKIVLMGDLNQRDEKIPKEKTGLYKFFNNAKARDSELVCCIELQKCERSPTAKLFADVFED